MLMLKWACMIATIPTAHGDIFDLLQMRALLLGRRMTLWG